MIEIWESNAFTQTLPRKNRPTSAPYVKESHNLAYINGDLGGEDEVKGNEVSSSIFYRKEFY